MAPTLQDLLDHRALGLKLVVAGTEGALDRQVAWVSGSDLPDPTPFLLADQVLLTTGTQFGTAVSTTQVEAYVARLRGRGIRSVTGRVLGDESFYDSRRGAPGWKQYFIGGESPPLSALVVDRARGWPAPVAACRSRRCRIR